MKCLRQSSSPAFLSLHLIILKIPEVQGDTLKRAHMQVSCDPENNFDGMIPGIPGGLALVTAGAGGNIWGVFCMFCCFDMIVLIAELCKEVTIFIHLPMDTCSIYHYLHILAIMIRATMNKEVQIISLRF